MSVEIANRNEKSSSSPLSAAPDRDANQQVIPRAAIESALRGLRYGLVQIIIQDGIVIQIDKTEKIRLSKSAAS